MASLVWLEGGQLRREHLAQGLSFIGRGQDATIQVQSEDHTVSRLHAQIRAQGPSTSIEHLPTARNPTVVGGNAVDRTELKDGDEVQLGTLKMTFHDLSRATLLSGIVCNNCSRENEASGKDCWYCGQNLVNAPSVVLKNRGPACRLVPAAGAHKNLFIGQHLAIKGDGTIESGRGHDVPQGAVAAVIGRDDNAAVLRPMGGPVSLNGQPLQEERILQDGDQVLAAGQLFVALLG
jgi:hypothetical protein